MDGTILLRAASNISPRSTLSSLHSKMVELQSLFSSLRPNIDGMNIVRPKFELSVDVPPDFWKDFLRKEPAGKIFLQSVIQYGATGDGRRCHSSGNFGQIHFLFFGHVFWRTHPRVVQNGYRGSECQR